MAIQILGADGLTVLKVDTPSQAARVTLYDQYGNPMSDVNSLGNVLNALNAAVTLTLGGQGTAGFAVTGTTGTITLAFEYTIDSTNWFALAVTPVAGGSTVTTTSVNGQWVASVAGFYGVRARVSAITGGASMTVSMTLGPEMSKQVAQAITTAGALTVEISDGTNGPANVTPPSTPASAAEEALVVALSPNSPLPTGSNVIGALTANQSVNLTEIDGTTTVTGGEAGSLGVGGLAASGSAVVGNPVLVAGSDGTDARAILTDTSGRPEVVGAAASGSAVVGNPVLVAGSDGTDARTITTDASGHPVVVGDGTAGSPAGGVVSVQGVSGGQAVPVSGTVTATVTGTVTSNQGTANTVANSWPVEITDGTNVLGTAAHPVRVDPTGTTTQPVSGSVTVTQSTPSNLQGEVGGLAASGSPPVGNPVLVAGSDGTDARTIATDASGHPVVVGDGTAGTPAGGVVSVQGVSGGQAVPISGSVTATVTGSVTANQGTPNTEANAWPMEITDGTHGPAAVKAASTPAAAADPSLVVALSPNSPIPTGSNLVGQVEITDGTNVLGTAAHPVRVDPTGTTPQPVSGTVTGNQGTANTVANSWPVEITDGTNVLGTAAHPVRTDPTGTTPQPVSGTVTANQGSAAVLSGHWPVQVTDGTNTMPTADVAARKAFVALTDGTNGPAAVKPASVQAVAADPALTVSVSPNSISAKDRTNIGFGTQQLAPVAGSDNGIARILRASESGTIRTTSEIMLWHDAFEGATVNAFWTQSTTTQTIAQAVGVLTLNNSNITTLNTDSIITSQRQFPKYPRNPLFVRFRALITANVASNHTFVELGLGAPSGVTAIINNGAFFRWTSAGNLNAVVSYNGTETSTQILAQGLISTTSYLYYDVFIDDDYARFIVSDSSGTPIVDTQLNIALTAPFISAVSHLPVFARVYVDATGGGTAVQLKLSAHSVQLVDGLFNTSFGEQMAYSMRSSIINPTTYAQTPQLAAGAAPATITPNNTGSTAYTTLGGEYAVALTAGSENLLGIFAFTIPTPYSFVLTNLTWQTPVVTTAISVTGIPFIEWAVIINATSVSPSTGGGFRFNPGLGFAYTAITQAAGVACTLAGNNNWLPQAPIICLPGTVLILAYKVLVTTAAGTPGVTRGSVYVGGYFK